MNNNPEKDEKMKQEWVSLVDLGSSWSSSPEWGLGGFAISAAFLVLVEL